MTKKRIAIKVDKNFIKDSYERYLKRQKRTIYTYNNKEIKLKEFCKLKGISEGGFSVFVRRIKKTSNLTDKLVNEYISYSDRKCTYKGKLVRPCEIVKAEKLSDWTFKKYIKLYNYDVDKAIAKTREAMEQSPDKRRLEKWKLTFEGKTYSNVQDLLKVVCTSRDKLFKLYEQYGKNWSKHITKRFSNRYGMTVEQFIKPFRVSHGILNTWARKENIVVDYATKEELLNLIKKNKVYEFTFRGKTYRSIDEAFRDNRINLTGKQLCNWRYKVKKQKGNFLSLNNKEKEKLLEEFVQYRRSI